MPNEFTIYHDAHGQPVRCALSDMRPGQVIASLRLYGDEASRLGREAEPAGKMLQAIRDGVMDAYSFPHAAAAAAEAVQRALDANKAWSSLLKQVRARLGPHWRRNQDVAMGELIRRHWPEPLSVFSSADNNS